jgi:hypothetical protein
MLREYASRGGGPTEQGNVMTKQAIARAVRMAAGLTLIIAGTAWAKGDCSSLPPSALRTRSCNPQAECLKAIPKDLKGRQAEARRKECSRMPEKGVCHGPDTYNPQAECREGPRKR